MNQNESPALETRGARADLDATQFPRFEISNLRRVEYGRVRARFDLEVGPVRLLDCNLVVDRDGQPSFVGPGAVKDSYGSYRSTSELSRPFKEQVFEAVVSELRGDRRAAAQTDDTAAAPERHSWAEDQEARFDRAVAELDGAA